MMTKSISGISRLCPIKSSAPYECIEGRCAWWVEPRPVVDDGIPGHCAILDLARKVTEDEN
jgi:hypothetical protein